MSTLAIVGALEGAFVLAGTLRNTQPLLAAGRTLGPQYRGVALDRTPLSCPRWTSGRVGPRSRRADRGGRVGTLRCRMWALSSRTVVFTEGSRPVAGRWVSTRGCTRCGPSVIEGGTGRKVVALDVEVVRTPSDQPLHRRLLIISDTVEHWMDTHHPDVIAIERVSPSRTCRR